MIFAVADPAAIKVRSNSSACTDAILTSSMHTSNRKHSTLDFGFDTSEIEHLYSSQQISIFCTSAVLTLLIYDAGKGPRKMSNVSLFVHKCLLVISFEIEVINMEFWNIL